MSYLLEYYINKRVWLNKNVFAVQIRRSKEKADSKKEN
jgi:hypothetical protein